MKEEEFQKVSEAVRDILGKRFSSELTDKIRFEVQKIVLEEKGGTGSVQTYLYASGATVAETDKIFESWPNQEENLLRRESGRA